MPCVHGVMGNCTPNRGATQFCNYTSVRPFVFTYVPITLTLDITFSFLHGFLSYYSLPLVLQIVLHKLDLVLHVDIPQYQVLVKNNIGHTRSFFIFLLTNFLHSHSQHSLPLVLWLNISFVTKWQWKNTCSMDTTSS